MNPYHNVLSYYGFVIIRTNNALYKKHGTPNIYVRLRNGGVIDIRHGEYYDDSRFLACVWNVDDYGLYKIFKKLNIKRR
jgi:hypothetical protein